MIMTQFLGAAQTIRDRIRQYIAFKLKNTTDENTQLIDNIGTYLTHIWSFIKKRLKKIKQSI